MQANQLNRKMNMSSNKFSSKQTLTLDVTDSDKIVDLKKKIQAKQQIPYHQQRLIFSGKELEDNKV